METLELLQATIVKKNEQLLEKDVRIEELVKGSVAVDEAVLAWAKEEGVVEVEEVKEEFEENVEEAAEQGAEDVNAA